MKYKMILPLLLLPFFLNAQIIKERDVIASGGGSFSSANLKVDYSIAEICVKHLNAASLELTQGFIQPLGIYIGINEEQTVNNINVYPNPFSDLLHVSIGVTEGSDWECYITDMLGRRVTDSYTEIPGSQSGSFSIDCSSFQHGAYLIHFNRHYPKQAFTYKLIKTK